MPFELPKLDPAEAAAFARECRQISQRQDASVAGYRRDYQQSVAEARRRKSTFELGMYVSGGSALTPADLLSPSGTWWSATRGFTVGVTCDWVDQLDDPITATQNNEANFPAVVGGEYVQFNGTGDYFDLPVVAKTSPTTEYYVAMWKRRTSVAAVQTLLSQYGAGSLKTYQWHQNTSGVTQLQAGTPTAINDYPLDTINTIVFEESIYRGTEATAANRLRLYRDLVEVSRTGSSGTIPATLPAHTNARMGAYSLANVQHAGFDVWHIYIDRVIPDLDVRTALMNFEAPV